MMAQVSRRRLHRSGEPLEWDLDAVLREAEPPGYHQEVDRVENPLYQEGQDRGRDRSLEDESVLSELNPGEDGFSQAPRADQGCQGGRTHIDDGARLDPGHDR